MDHEFIIRETDEEVQRRPSLINLTGWEAIVFEVADEEAEPEE